MSLPLYPLVSAYWLLLGKRTRTSLQPSQIAAVRPNEMVVTVARWGGRYMNEGAAGHATTDRHRPDR